MFQAQRLHTLIYYVTELYVSSVIQCFVGEFDQLLSSFVYQCLGIVFSRYPKQRTRQSHLETWLRKLMT